MRELSSAEIEAVNGAYGVPGAVAGAAAGAAGYAGSMLGGGKFSGRDFAAATGAGALGGR
jgi:hypothetical protein